MIPELRRVPFLPRCKALSLKDQGVDLSRMWQILAKGYLVCSHHTRMSIWSVETIHDVSLANGPHYSRAIQVMAYGF
jgi:hypothetical protein